MVTTSEIADGKALIGVVGLGYVGLPLAVAFGKKVPVLGYDVDEMKIAQLESGTDVTSEMNQGDLSLAKIRYTNDPEELKRASFIIVAVPTPVDVFNDPNLDPVRAASRTIGKYLSIGAIVVFESTVYPGVTEDICIPILERESGLECGIDFSVGYSPERINPGDRVHTIDNIVKIVSAVDITTRDTVASVYRLIISAGVFAASSIRVAEAAKVVENTQRDLNIALMNELSLMFNQLNISTRDVLAAARTKWNFLDFRPGLVGGHCIGVDPYYLTYKAESIGYDPQIIRAGRRINNRMGKFVAEQTIKMMIRAGMQVNGARVLIMGITYKSDVPDTRNSRVFDIIRELTDFGVELVVSDPLADQDRVLSEHGVVLTEIDSIGQIDTVVWAVDHEVFRKVGSDILHTVSSRARVFIDINSTWDREEVESYGYSYWSL